jgi:hypothetical protein
MGKPNGKRRVGKGVKQRKIDKNGLESNSFSPKHNNGYINFMEL